MKKLILLLGIAATVILGGCTNAPSENKEPAQEQQTSAPTLEPTASPEPDSTATPAPSEPQANNGSAGGGNGQEPTFKSAKDAAAAVIKTLKDKDVDSLNAYIHPANGIRFSPYVHIDSETAVQFQAGKLPSLDDETVYTWGAYDGSGEPIELTFGQYYDRFVYDHDYSNAQEVGWDSILGSGTTTPNLKEIYPDCYLVDYHFKGFDEQFEGMDWASLVLVLQEHEGGWYVSAIAHSGWTI